jgi:hypothetical protein
LKYRFDSKAGIILVKTKVSGPRGDAIVNLALDTGATWTLISWETAVLVGYDPASIQQRTAITTGSGIEYCPKLNLLRVEALGLAVWRLYVTRYLRQVEWMACLGSISCVSLTWASTLNRVTSLFVDVDL